MEICRKYNGQDSTFVNVSMRFNYHRIFFPTAILLKKYLETIWLITDMKERAVLASLNKEVNQIDADIIEKLPGKYKVYKSYDCQR